MATCLSPSIPRALDLAEFISEPFQFLERAGKLHGRIFVLRESAPILSRAADCAGVIAVSGVAHQRSVLTDIETFGMPPSAAHQLKLPRSLVNLNRGLHSMPVAKHGVHKRLLLDLLSDERIRAFQTKAWAALQEITDWEAGTTVRLLQRMREVMRHVASRLLFGEEHKENLGLTLLLESYFHLRRDAASPAISPDERLRKLLVTTGSELDTALRSRVREYRRQNSATSDGLLREFATLRNATGRLLSEDEVVGHGDEWASTSRAP